MSGRDALKIFEGVYTYVTSMNIFFYLEKSKENTTQSAIYTKIHLFPNMFAA